MSVVSAPSRAGRSPYNSEPSIEAPDSTTTSRRIDGETPAIKHHPHRQSYPAALRDRHPKRRAYRRADCSRDLPERSGRGVMASVEAGGGA